MADALRGMDAAEYKHVVPAPTITVVNRQNGHGHLLYGIDTPVRMETWGGRRAPARYLADVERAMTVQLGADPSYSGFTCKNPLHRHWVTLSGGCRGRETNNLWITHGCLWISAERQGP